MDSVNDRFGTVDSQKLKPFVVSIAGKSEQKKRLKVN